MPETESQPAAAPPKRRWYQYSLRTLLMLPLVLALVLSAVYSWPYAHRRYSLWRLQDYVDKDLTTLPRDEQRRLEAWSESLIGKYERPLKLHNIDIPGIGQRMLIVESRPRTISALPEYGDYRIHSLDSWRRATQITTLDLGGDPLSIEFDESRRGFLCMTLAYEDDGPNGVKRFFFRVADGNAELIRVEKYDGTVWAYLRPVSLPERIEMPNLLESSDLVQQLRGLAAYLYGNPFRWKNIDDKTRRRFAELADSPDPWVSEEAKFALEWAIEK